MIAFSYSVPVRFHEVDSAGIVFFARIFQYAHHAYEAWMRAIGFPLEPPPPGQGYGLPLVHAEADYHAPIRLGEDVHIELGLVSVGTTSFTLRAELSSVTGTRFATVTTVHVCIDWATGLPCLLPDGFRRVLLDQSPPTEGGPPT